jgi:hypothetical protein
MIFTTISSVGKFAKLHRNFQQITLFWHVTPCSVVDICQIDEEMIYYKSAEVLMSPLPQSIG